MKIKPLFIALITGTLVACGDSDSGITNFQPYQKIQADFVHRWDKSSGTHPFSGAAAIDYNQDGQYELYISGGEQQSDALLAFENNQLINIIDKTGLDAKTAGYGATAIDLDNDQDTDLIVARNDGVWLYINDNAQFKAQKLNVDSPKQAIPFDVAVSDIDHDGLVDLYISYFVDFPNFKSGIYNDDNFAKKNILLHNQGNLKFKDITKSAGVSGKHNSFMSCFVDLDNDGYQDLVVANNTGQVEIFKNNQDLTFAQKGFESGFGFWMGMAIGDIDKDGDQDVLLTNVSDSIPAFLTTGDLKEDQKQNLEYILLENQGNFKFSDKTKAYGLKNLGFAWGAMFEDLNLDGELDLLIAQNYIKWPIHKVWKLAGKSMIQEQKGNNRRFLQVDGLRLQNKHYGQSPVILDMNKDGKLDVVWLNMNGPVRAYLNNNQNHFITVALPNTAKSLGAKITIKTDDGQSYTKEVIKSLGLMTDSSLEYSFGLNDTTKVQKVSIQLNNGEVIERLQPEIDQTLKIHY